MSKSLEMFSLCHIALVDLGQRFLCNLAVITKEVCAGKTAFLPLNPAWKSFDPSLSPLDRPLCRGNIVVACLFSALTPVTRTGEAHCSYLKWYNSSGARV